MARPQKTGMDYFPHDTDATTDEKIEILRALYGNDGYAFYFIILERIYRTDNFELKIAEVCAAQTLHKPPTNDEETIMVLSRKIMISPEVFIKIMNSCFKHNLFSLESYLECGVLTSDGIKKRALPVFDKRCKMRKLRNKNEYDGFGDGVCGAQTQHNDGVCDAQTGVCAHKVKESKVKESKEESVSNETPVSGQTGKDPCPHFEIIKIFHETLPTLPKVKSWGDQARKNLRTRWREDKDRQNVEWWSGFFEYISKSDFLMGKKTSFQATLLWIVGPKNFEKIISGIYENRCGPEPPSNFPGSTTGSRITDQNIRAAKEFVNG